MSATETPRDKLISEIKLRLGDGMIDVELDPEHYNLAIDRAIQTLRSRSDSAVEESYAFLGTQVDTQEYTLPSEVLNIRRIYRRGVGGGNIGTGTNFDPFDVAFQNTYLINAGVVGGLANYDAFTQYKETLNRIFGGEYDFTFNSNTKVLKILRKISVAEDIMMQVSNLVPEQSLIQNEYTRPWMADWALAEAKMMLGEARSKYSSGLPGPGGAVQLNGEALKQEAASEKERLLVSIINMEEGNRNYGFIIG
ncbi:hypothetical protein N9H30_00590 [bacterium]|nr:hypothetical protein [bacterium]|tara:strand:+ start:5634 stop:6389 length:756 start_codon:yes stop_codon:yes gene_type:complete